MTRKPKGSAVQLAAARLRTGRPPKPRTEKQSHCITVYLTPAELQRFRGMARMEGVSLAEVVMRPWRREDH